jgi:hypothetical protein
MTAEIVMLAGQKEKPKIQYACCWFEFVAVLLLCVCKQSYEFRVLVLINREAFCVFSYEIPLDLMPQC